MRVKSGKIPLWLKSAYTAMVAVIVPFYWVHHGPENFLWFSDIALLVLVIALWRESALLNSMMAVGTLPLELAWVVGFMTGGRLGITGYMFDESLPLWLRGLSLFHLVLPPVMAYMLLRLGYDRRALPFQIMLTLVVLPVTWLVADPAEDNINWVFGPAEPQDFMPPLLWLALTMIVLPLLVIAPTHFILKRLVPPPGRKVD